MPARLVQLLICIDATLDYADADLDAGDRQLFLDRVFQLIVNRRNQPAYPTRGVTNMPARWVELLIRIQATADDATRTLAPGDLTMFDDALFSWSLRRTLARDRHPFEHPLPSGQPGYTRDPSGD